MPATNIFSVTASKVQGPQGSGGRPTFEYKPDTAQDIVVSGEFVIVPEGDGSLIYLASGIQIVCTLTPSEIETAISAADATGT